MTDSPPIGRGQEARVGLARAFILQVEALTRIKMLTMPRYRRLNLVQSNAIVASVHTICREVVETLFTEGQPMPADRYAPLSKDMWTAQGDNGSDPPMNVGVFGTQRDAHQWCDRQNETQHQQNWGRGSAGPMHFKPVPIYEARGLDPKVTVLPERQWDQDDAAHH